jgi:adenosylcobinamide-GDP ribazoletransferase
MTAPPDRHRSGGGPISALAFLTILGRSRAPTPAALVWFAPVGALVGAAVGGTWWGASALWPALVAAVLAVTVDLALTGLLHVDGLADTADGLLPHLERDRRLQVIAEPTVGAFAVAAVVVVLLVRVAAISGLPDSWRAMAFTAGVWAASRTLMAVAIAVLPAARPAGLAAAFVGASAVPVLTVGLFLTLAGTVSGRGLVGLVAVTTGVLAGTGVLVLARRRLGGYTGDVLGASGMVVETVALLTGAARW